MRFTLGSIRASRIPHVLGVCTDDDRLVQWANTAQQRLLDRGRWFGTVVRVRINVSNGCIVWPREVAVIEKIMLCCKPIATHGLWYEFTEYVNPYCCDYRTDPRLVDMSGTPTVSDIDPNRNVIAYSTNVADDGKYIVVQGYDSNGNWVRTDDGSGNPIDGERIELDTAGTVSTTIWNSITGIQKDVTDYDVTLYQYDTSGPTQEKLLGVYQSNEQYPEYRKSMLRGIEYGCCEQEDCEDPTYAVEVLAKLQHIPVSADGDWFILQNQPAMELAMKAVKLEEDGKDGEAELSFKKAIRELQHQVRSMSGDKLSYLTTGHGSASPIRVFGNFI